MTGNILRALTVCVAFALVTPARADIWTSRPIKLVVPTGAGTATDVIARLVSDGLSRKLGKAMVVENMPGASGIIAHEAVARANPDGHTLAKVNSPGPDREILFQHFALFPLSHSLPAVLTGMQVTV